MLVFDSGHVDSIFSVAQCQKERNCTLKYCSFFFFLEHLYPIDVAKYNNKMDKTNTENELRLNYKHDGVY